MIWISIKLYLIYSWFIYTSVHARIRFDNIVWSTICYFARSPSKSLKIFIQRCSWWLILTLVCGSCGRLMSSFSLTKYVSFSTFLLHIQHVFLARDLNIHVERPDDPHARLLLSTLASYGFSCCVDSPSHRGGGTFDVHHMDHTNDHHFNYLH